MNRKLLCLALAVFFSTSSFAFTDSLWIVGAEGLPGDLVTVEVWLQYEGGGPGDSMQSFDIPLTWDANVCTVEGITIGTDFGHWVDQSHSDNVGTDGPPAVPKLVATALGGFGPWPRWVERGTHLAATVDFRIQENAASESTCIDTLMRAFSPPVFLGFVDEGGINTYVPSFSTNCVRVLPYTDSLWIVGGEGVPGGLAQVEVWLEYEGAGGEDMLSAFDIPLTWDAAVCTLELIALGPDFVAERWYHQSRIDNQGVMGAPYVSKVGLSSFHMGPGVSRWFVQRGSHLVAVLHFRILRTAAPFDSACMDTLMEAFSPPIFLGFADMPGIVVYIPSFSTGCIAVVPCTCGDTNGDRRITVADPIYISTYIYKGGNSPICEGDVNLDGRVTSADAIYLLAYIYRDGPEPCNPP
jgi:hypothetical protein